MVFPLSFVHQDTELIIYFFLFLPSYELNFMTSRPGPGVYTISIRLVDVSQLIITVTISSNVNGALAALFFCNWTPVIGQLKQPIILSPLS